MAVTSEVEVRPTAINQVLAAMVRVIVRVPIT